MVMDRSWTRFLPEKDRAGLPLEFKPTRPFLGALSVRFKGPHVSDETRARLDAIWGRHTAARTDSTSCDVQVIGENPATDLVSLASEIKRMPQNPSVPRLIRT